MLESTTQPKKALQLTVAAIYELQSDIAFRKADTDTPITKAEIDQFFSRSKQISNDAEQALASNYAP